jgi:hypothetical protein
VGSGKVTATHIAEKVFAAMAEEQFYIFSHPHALGNVQARMEDILQLRNPTDAFAGRPKSGSSCARHCAQRLRRRKPGRRPAGRVRSAPWQGTCW